MENRFRRILVRATNWVGDAVMSVPALQALRENNPQARISILARPWVAGLYGRESFCDDLIPYDVPRGWQGLREKRRVAVELRKRKFDCAVLLQNAFEAAALARWAGIPIRVGYDRDARGWLLTHPIPLPAKGEISSHQRFYYLELLKRAKLIPGYRLNETIRLGGSAEAGEKGRGLLRKAGFEGAVVGVSPGAAYGGAKRWLPERFAEAATTLAQERNARVAVFGSKQEAAICEAVCSAIVGAGVACRNFAGDTPLDQFVEMAAACEIFLTNDSGAMHVASALGVPTVAVFGATDDVATGPTGTWSRVVRHQVECSPCLLRECPIDHRCMTGVSASQVVAAAQELVAIRGKVGNKGLDTREKIVPAAGLAARLGEEEWVAIAGSFDPLTLSHAERLAAASGKGKPVLAIVEPGLNSLMPVEARAVLVAALDSVALVVVSEAAALPKFPRVEVFTDERGEQARSQAFMEHVQGRRAAK